MLLNLLHPVWQTLDNSELFPKRRSLLSLGRSIHQFIFLLFQYFLSSFLPMSFSLLDFHSILETRCLSSYPSTVRLLFQYQYVQNCQTFADHRVSLLFFSFLFFNVKSTLRGFVCVETLTLQRGNCWIYWLLQYLGLHIFVLFCFEDWFYSISSPVEGTKYMQIRKCIFADF